MIPLSHRRTSFRSARPTCTPSLTHVIRRWGQDDFWSSIQEDPQQQPCRPLSPNYPPSPVTGWETHSPVADMDEKPVSSGSSSVAPMPSAMVMSRGAFEFDNAGASAAWPVRTSNVGKRVSAAKRTYVLMTRLASSTCPCPPTK